MVGEAPGQSENVLGFPFVGDAGALLDQLISEATSSREVQEAITDFSKTPRVAFANIVCCIPWDTEGDHTVRPPNKVEIKACQSNLLETIRIAQPNKILRVGKVSATHLPLKQLPGLVHADCMSHPAAILHMSHNPDTARLMYSRAKHMLITVLVSSIVPAGF